MVPAGDTVKGSDEESDGAMLSGREGPKACFKGEKPSEGLKEENWGIESADRSTILRRLLALG